MRKILVILSVFFLWGCSNSQENTSVSSLPPQKTYTILALGDSLTAGYGVEDYENYPSQLQKLLESKNYSYTLVNAGVSGDTSDNVLSRASLYLDQKPDMVILVVGGNDGLRGLDVQEMKKNIEAIIKIFQDKNIPVILGGMDIPMNLGIKYREDFKQVYQDIAQENKKVVLFPFFLEGVAGNKDLNIADMIHPNQKGYAIIVKNLFDFLEKNNLLLK